MSSRIAQRAILLACVLAGAAGARGAAQSEDGAFRMVERTDYSLYKDGRYVGHVYREARGALIPLRPEALASGAARGALIPLRPEALASGSAGEMAEGYGGDFYVLEETLRDMRSSARAVDRVLPARLSLGAWGAVRMERDSGYPTLRGLPEPPPEDLAPGGAWSAPGERILELPDGSYATLPFLAEYRIVGEGDYVGTPALILRAKFATRLQRGSRLPAAAPTSASGTHDLDIYVEREGGRLLFVRDRFDESFGYSGGATERRSGFMLLFFEGAEPLDRDRAIAAIDKNLGGSPAAPAAATAPAAAAAPAAAGGPSSPEAGAASPIAPAAPGGVEPAPGPDAAAGLPASVPAPAPAPASAPAGAAVPEAGVFSGAPDFASAGAAGPGPILAGEAGIEIEDRPEGILLRVKDLRFVADSEKVLDTELWRLDALASALKAVPGRRFLIAGHAASVGKPAGELGLSKARAKKVADELAARGIEASRMMYEGYGSSEPLSPNDTEEGRARNRRVEITILDY